MKRPKKSIASSPLDSFGTDESLATRLVDRTQPTRIAGYSVLVDLAAHYSWSETLFLLCTGELPTEDAAKVFDACLIAISSVGDLNLELQIGSLARVAGALPLAQFGMLAMGAADSQRSLERPFRELSSWLTDRTGALPKSCLGTRSSECASSSLRRLFRTHSRSVKGPTIRRARAWALICILLDEIGIRDPEAWLFVTAYARLAVSWAETIGEKRGALRRYPMHAVPFRYQSGSRQ